MIKVKVDHTEETLKEIKRKLSYDPFSGKFHWKFVDEITKEDIRHNSRLAGKEAGSMKTSSSANQEGYVIIKCNRISFKAHRLAWWFYYGEWPDDEIDHIDHIRSNNKIKNLRLVNRVNQNKNSSKRKDNSSGYCGASWSKNLNSWYCYINVNKKRIHLGYFNNIEDAISKRLEAEKFYGFHKSHGKEVNTYE